MTWYMLNDNNFYDDNDNDFMIIFMIITCYGK